MTFLRIVGKTQEEFERDSVGKTQEEFETDSDLKKKQKKHIISLCRENITSETVVHDGI